MPNNAVVENNFIGGLKTEFTALNFPTNACTQVDNCVFSLIGDVLRREGINFEPDYALQNIDMSFGGSGGAISTFRWDNAGGDGESQVQVVQVGNILYFFYITGAAGTDQSVSAQLMTTPIDIDYYAAFYAQEQEAVVPTYPNECQYAQGNGYLFVFHPACDPFYVTFTKASGTPVVSSAMISIYTRDFIGIFPEPGNPPVSLRPSTLSNEHLYNLQNQGWTNGQQWSTNSSTNILVLSGGGSGNFINMPLGSQTFTIPSGLTIANGTGIGISWTASVFYEAVSDGDYGTTGSGTANGTVTSYSGTSLVVNITSQTGFSVGSGGTILSWSGVSDFIYASNLTNTINTWHTDIGNYPSNSDIWWEYKDDTGTYNPSTTINDVSTSLGQAPNGHFLMFEFQYERNQASGISGVLTVPYTYSRPRTGAFYAGRVWYAGVDDTFAPSGDIGTPFTWTERIYFSQVITDPTDFGNCFQVNDPTSEDLNGLLPTDGGYAVIQGCGAVYKLFPIQNGLLVFAANGVWFITGGSGLGFTADDYTITKISAIQSINGSSYVDVNGLPMFWNQEGIYMVSPGQEQVYKYGSFNVEPLTIGTILTFYNDIPFASRQYARGAYDPVNYVITWIYRSTQEAGLSNRYFFDSALSLNIHNKAFYPYTFSGEGTVNVHGIEYMNYDIVTSLVPQFKYTTGLQATNQMTFSEENDNVNWVDFYDFNNTGFDYTSSFTTGYRVDGGAYKKWDPIYVVVYSNDSIANQYNIQGVWDFATTNLGRFTNIQVITNPQSITFASGLPQAPPGGYGFTYRRHKIRGHGQALQLMFSSNSGQPFHIIGWAIPEQQNVGA